MKYYPFYIEGLMYNTPSCILYSYCSKIYFFNLDSHKASFSTWMNLIRPTQVSAFEGMIHENLKELIACR